MRVKSFYATALLLLIALGVTACLGRSNTVRTDATVAQLEAVRPVPVKYSPQTLKAVDAELGVCKAPNTWRLLEDYMVVRKQLRAGRTTKK